MWTAVIKLSIVNNRLPNQSRDSEPSGLAGDVVFSFFRMCKKCKCKSNLCQTQRVLAQSPEPEAHDKVLDNSRSNWNLEMLVFEERGKPEDPGKTGGPVAVPRFIRMFER